MYLNDFLLELVRFFYFIKPMLYFRDILSVTQIIFLKEYNIYKRMRIYI